MSHAVDDTEGATVVAARAGDERAFERLVASHRRGLHLHCYRMLGNVEDADDALQEALVRAWRGLPTFQPRWPIRAWLYRIATNVCLTADGRRRARVANETAAGDALEVEVARVGPYAAPAEEVEQGEQIQLAFVTAAQLLPARQRAVLLLRDALDFSAQEVAAALETTVPAVNSALQRARRTVEREMTVARLARPHEPVVSADELRLAEDFARAWDDADVDGVVRLLAADALVTMPPQPLRVAGRHAIATFLTAGPLRSSGGQCTSLVTRANDQPALAVYCEGGRSGRSTPYALLVLAMGGGQIVSVCRFGDPHLFARLGLPADIETPHLRAAQRA